MPKLRRLSGSAVIAILEEVGFEVLRVKGSHYRLRIRAAGNSCYVSVPAHGNKPLATGTLSAIYRQACGCVDEERLRPHFYAD
jgi:predicted RNA binding protein YcfA (HicA-like mRNA interferase family)